MREREKENPTRRDFEPNELSETICPRARGDARPASCFFLLIEHTLARLSELSFCLVVLVAFTRSPNILEAGRTRPTLRSPNLPQRRFDESRLASTRCRRQDHVSLSVR